MSKRLEEIKHIENTLAQTQCRLCEYDDCLAYATAIVDDNEAIDRCLPGGESTLLAIAELTQQNPEPYLDKIRNNTKPITLAVIREDECIGCTKCIQACPVDAIIGSGKQMHTVVNDLCNGCELCIPPCPVDCIDTIPHPQYSDAHEIAAQSQSRYLAHQERQKKQEAETQILKKDSLAQRQAAIQASIRRSQAKKDKKD